MVEWLLNLFMNSRGVNVVRQLLINLGYVGGFRFDKFNFVKQSKHTTFDCFILNHTTFRRSFSKKVLETILLPGPLSFTQFENTYPYQKNVLIRRPRTSALLCCHTAPFAESMCSPTLACRGVLYAGKFPPIVSWLSYDGFASSVLFFPSLLGCSWAARSADFISSPVISPLAHYQECQGVKRVSGDMNEQFPSPDTSSLMGI